jgi:hypothetical protein
VPDEVIVSVANAHLMDQAIITGVGNKFNNSFDNFKILLHDRTVPEGPNRGAGSLEAQHELIIYQDSDDIPHPQRIEVIKYFFENYDILHLNHAFTYEKGFHDLDSKRVNYRSSQDMFSLYFPEYLKTEQSHRTRQNRPRKVFGPKGNSLPYGSGFEWDITGGSTSILRSVLDKIEWKWEMDVSYDYDFCMDTLFYFNKSVIIDSPLIWYNRFNNMSWACGDR